MKSLWSQLNTKGKAIVIAAVAIVALCVVLMIANAVHDHGYSTGVSETDTQSQKLRDELNQYKGRDQAHIQSEQVLQKAVNERDVRIKSLEAQVAEDEKNTEKTRTIYRTVINRPAVRRPVGAGLSDRELSADAAEQRIDLNRNADPAGPSGHP